ncbi:MAG: RNA-binding S4 domain-containing protein [Saprospirales bacterium]|nr:MAG: RNA-binding S4 domain-containing protein [Saprospirales bacterium]
MKKVRVDKWLWAVRIFKSRSLATKACKEGAVKMGDDKLKPAHLIEPDNILTVKKNDFNLRIKVLKLLSKRVGAPIAQSCYTDLTPEEEYNKYEAWYNRKKQSEFREKGLGRPTKKDRREIDKLKKWL